MNAPKNTSQAVKTARLAAKSKPQIMVYLLEVRVDFDNIGDFETETLQQSLIEYAAVNVIDRTIVEGEI